MKRRYGIITILLAVLFFSISTVFATTDSPIDDSDAIDGGISNSEYEEEFDKVVERVYNLREEGFSFEEIDSALEKGSIKKEGALNVKGMSPSDKFYDYAHLNDIEKKLFKENRSKALLCLANGKLALKYSQEMYESSVLHNGNGDAFRHTLWNYGMAIDVGQGFAKKWADAHENGAKGQPKLEKQMDLYNNKIGRELAKTYPNTKSHSTFKKNSRAKVRAGKCRIISGKGLVKSSKKGEK